MRRFLVIAGLLCTSSVCLAQDFDFKGVYLDQPATPAEIKSKLGVDCGAGRPGFQICNGRVTVAGRNADMNLVIGQSGKVQRIALTFDTSSFNAVENALMQKFGAPKVEIGQVQNRMGAKYDDRTDVWGEAPGPTVRLSQHAGSLDEASLRFWTEEDRVMLERLNNGDPSDI